MQTVEDTTKCLQKCARTKVNILFLSRKIYPKGKSLQYWIEVLDSLKNIEWKKDWMSEVYFQSNGIKEVSKEYYTYESSDLLGDFGGYLGLFLGWSLLGLSQGVFTVCSNVLRSRIPPLHKMT